MFNRGAEVFLAAGQASQAALASGGVASRGVDEDQFEIVALQPVTP
ncbi:hypothetical protein D558_2499 [Bordetella holmesii 44057]|nr:hypothetical protein D558_2499 [Bordetella holmesii 44057]